MLTGGAVGELPALCSVPLVKLKPLHRSPPALGGHPPSLAYRSIVANFQAICKHYIPLDLLMRAVDNLRRHVAFSRS